jgi:uncharacterized membrane-anchored protein
MILVGLRSIFFSAKLVFSKWPYILLGGAVTTIFWIIFNVFDQLLLFSPVVTFYLPDDAVAGFIISNITAVLAGAVISMNRYAISSSPRLTNMKSMRLAAIHYLIGIQVYCINKGMLTLNML